MATTDISQPVVCADAPRPISKFTCPWAEGWSVAIGAGRAVHAN